MVRVPQVEQRGKNAANWLYGAALALGPPPNFESESSSSGHPAAEVWVIRDLWPDKFDWYDLQATTTIPNPTGLSCYHAMKHVIDVVPKDSVGLHAIQSRIESFREELFVEKAGLSREDFEARFGRILDTFTLRVLERAGLLLHTLENGWHDISSEEELSLKEFKENILSSAKGFIKADYEYELMLQEIEAGSKN